MDRKVFFDFVRNLPFSGRISPDQFDGLKRILDYQEEHYPNMDVRWLAYILATVFHETARTMQPIKEGGGEKYLKSKKYYPWYGRGLVQITWEDNYHKFGIYNPDDAYEWPTALHVLFEGMTKGMFTGKRLSQFFNKTADDPRGARKIVNGTDKDSLIAQYHRNFLDALMQARKAVEAPTEVRKPQPLAHLPDKPPLASDTLTQAVLGIGGIGSLSSILEAVTNPYALIAVFGIAVLVGVFLWKRKAVRDATGV